MSKKTDWFETFMVFTILSAVFVIIGFLVKIIFAIW